MLGKIILAWLLCALFMLGCIALGGIPSGGRPSYVSPGGGTIYDSGNFRPR